MLGDTLRPDHPYHHGNVKEALLDEALKLIQDNDAGMISLRRLSREVGVTPSAVYNHFADKDALLLAVKTRIYDDMNAYFEARRSATDNPEQALLEMCMSYYQFANEYPAQFQFLFSSTLPLEWSTSQTVEVSCRSILRTRKLVLQIYEKYKIPCSESAVVNATLLIWSQLHGIVVLRNSGSINAVVAYLNWPPGCALHRDDEVELLIRNHLEMMVNGIINSQRGQSQH